MDAATAPVEIDGTARIRGVLELAKAVGGFPETHFCGYIAGSPRSCCSCMAEERDHELTKLAHGPVIERLRAAGIVVEQSREQRDLFVGHLECGPQQYPRHILRQLRAF